MPTRRAFLGGLAAAAGLSLSGVGLAAAPGSRRLVVLTLRGGLDGLAAVVPYADPDYARARGDLALPGPGAEGGVVDLDGTFGLHPALSGLHPLWTAGELLPFHAVALPNGSRSHFEAQNMLETGVPKPYAVETGWVGRALVEQGDPVAIALGAQLPLLLRGTARATSVDPGGADAGSDDFLDRLAATYAGDPLLETALAEGRVAMGMVDEATPDGRGGRRSFTPVVRLLCDVLAKPDGPRVAVAALDGWDTHRGEAGALDGRLKVLADALVAVRDGLGPVWADTAVLVVTEFGRTVHVNGTAGADHGTAGVALLVGGAVNGGRVHTDWPGLAVLHEGRDLRATTDLRAVLAATCVDHLGVSASAVRDRVLPDATPLEGLFRA